MDQQPEEKRLNPQQLTELLRHAHQIVQKPLDECPDGEIDTLMNVILNTQFFQRNLDSRISIEDFVQRIKRFMTLETYPRGSVLLQEGRNADRLSVIVHGNAVRFRQRPLAEMEFEAAERNIGFSVPRPEEEIAANKSITWGVATENQISSNNKYYRASTFTSRMKVKGRSKKLGESRSHLKLPGASINMDLDQEERDRDSYSSNGSIGEVDEDDDDEPSEPILKTARSLHIAGTGKEIPADKKKKSPKKGEKKVTKIKVVQEPLIKNLMSALEIDEETNAITREHDINLFKMIVEESPQLITKYFVGDIFRLKRIREIVPGGHFGEAFLKNGKIKENLLVATTDITLLTITKDNYAKVMSQLFEEVQDKVKFFSSVFPSVTEETLTLFAYYFREQLVKKGEKIYSEDDLTDAIYLLRSGDVRLLKNVENMAKDKGTHNDSLLIGSSKSRPTLPIASVVEGQFFGEEILLREMRRSYTAISKTGSKVYLLEGWLYQKIKGNFVDLFNMLKNQAKEKLNWRLMRVEEMISSQLGGSIESVGNVLSLRKVGSYDLAGKQGHSAASQFPRQRVNSNGLDLSQVNTGVEGITMTEPSRPYPPSIYRPRQSIEFEMDNHTTKNLEVYKEKFYRKTYLDNVTANETIIKKTDHNKPKGNASLSMNMNMRIMDPIPIKKIDKASLSISVNQTQLPPLSKIASPQNMRIDNLTPINKLDDSFQALEKAKNSGARPTTKVVNNLRSNVLKFLVPELDQQGLDTPRKNKDVVKNLDGSMTVVTGRSRLRGILKSFEQVPHLYDAFQNTSPRSNKVYLAAIQSNVKTEGDQKVKPRKRAANIKHYEVSSDKMFKNQSQHEQLGAVIMTQKLNLAKQKI